MAIAFLTCLSILFSAIFFPPGPSVIVSLERSSGIDEFPVTFLTIPKPQRVLDQIRMSKLVLTIWLSYPASHVVLFSSASEYDPLNQILPSIATKFGSDRITFVEGLKTGYEGRPLIREWFEKGMQKVTQGFLCFTNADIIISEGWMDAARRIFATFKRTQLNGTMIFGTRTDVKQSTQIFQIDQNSPNFLAELTQYLQANTREDNPYGMDAVMVHSSFRCLRWDELPDFVIGMCVWDNFFMGWANSRCNTITMNFEVKLFHIDHGRNACNSKNYDFFRGMSVNSLYFEGWEEHKDARWMLRLNEEKLWSINGAIQLMR